LRSKNDPKTIGVPAQASMGTRVGVQRCAQPELGTGQIGDNDTERHDDDLLTLNSDKAGVTQGGKPPGRGDLKTRLADSGMRLTPVAKKTIPGLEAAIETLSGLIQFSKERRNVHKEIKEGLPLVMKLLRTCALKIEGGSKATSAAIGAGKSKTAATKEASTNTEVLREESSPKRAPKPPPEEPNKPDSGNGKSRRKKKRKKNKGHAAHQTASPPPPAIAEPNSTEAPKWSTVAKRGKPKPAAQMPAQASKTRMEAIAEAKRRIPKTAAVTVRLPPGSATTLASVMRQITTKVDLKALGIRVLDARASRTDGVILVVKKDEDAAALADKLSSVIGLEATVNRPVTTHPVLLLDVPDWIDAEDIQAALVEAGATTESSSPLDVTIRPSGARRGNNVARFALPVAAAVKIAEKSRLQIGWSRCRVKLLGRRPLTCFRCQDPGHRAADCKAPPKERKCFRCQKEGHLARDCDVRPPDRAKKKTSASEEVREVVPPSEAPAVQIRRDD